MLFKKKITCFLAIGGIFTILGTANVYASNIGFTIGDNINVRKEASINSDILSKLSTGLSIDIISAEGDWFKIKHTDGSSVYIAKQFVKLVQADGIVVDDSVNIRALPSKDSEILAKVSAGTMFCVNSVSGDFYNIEYNGKNAYIHKDYLLGDLINYIGQAPDTISMSSTPEQESVYALVISSTGLNLRQQPSQDSPVLVTLSSGAALDVVEIGEQWHKVSYNDTTGYVNAEFVSINKGIKPENSKGTQIIEYAKQFLGTPYVWSGTNLKSGVDCSGFTYAVMRDNGININRSSRDQIKNGVNVSKDSLKIGDLVFFDTTNATNKGYISHVGIYMGGGQFIHSSSSKKSYCVTISSLSEDYYIKRYVGATRVIG